MHHLGLRQRKNAESQQQYAHNQIQLEEPTGSSGPQGGEGPEAAEQQGQDAGGAADDDARDPRMGDQDDACGNVGGGQDCPAQLHFSVIIHGVSSWPVWTACSCSLPRCT